MRQDDRKPLLEAQQARMLRLRTAEVTQKPCISIFIPFFFFIVYFSYIVLE